MNVPEDKGYIEFWKHFEERAANLQDRLWTLGVWLLGLPIAMVGFLFDQHMITFGCSRVIVRESFPVAGAAFLGILLCLYTLLLTMDGYGHITRNWDRSTACKKNMRLLIEILEKSARSRDGRKRLIQAPVACLTLFAFATIFLVFFLYLLVLSLTSPGVKQNISFFIVFLLLLLLYSIASIWIVRQRAGKAALAFETQHLSESELYRDPDGSKIRKFPDVNNGGLCHCTLAPGKTSLAHRHRAVEEIWYCIQGKGEVWRKQGSQDETVGAEAGVSLTIPAGTHFQFRNTGSEPLVFISATMPPWPGEEEAVRVKDHWPVE